ncbi:MAG: hypothetical protein IJN05_06375 [Ruminococcus sp.]|nr:hypothetical protein [Ruminococcus sp.]
MDKELKKFEQHIYSQVSDSFRQMAQTMAETGSMLDDLKAVAAEKDSIISELNEEINSLKSRNEQLQTSVNAQSEKIADYEKNIVFFEQVKIDSVKLADLIRKEEDAINSLDEEKHKLIEIENKYLTENERLKSDNGNLKRQLNSKQHEFDEAVASNRIVVQEKDNKIGFLEQDKDDLTKKLTAAESQLEKHEAKNKKLKEEIEKSKEEISELKKQLRELSEKADDKDNEQSDEVSAETEKLIYENDELNIQVDKLKQDVQWLIGYAKGIDGKIKNYFKNQKNELEAHHNWLCNKPKDETYKRLLESELKDKPEVKKVRLKGNADN